MKMPQVKQDYYPMKGGLDLLTPAIQLFPGKVFDAQNYEPEISGGYKRIYGYERFDGHTSPTAATYSLISITLSGTIAVGDTVTGATSGATGKALGLFNSNQDLILGRVTGTFVSGENLQVSAATQAVSTSTATVGGSGSPSNDADYTLLAANDLRTSISAVPGSGRIRGIWVFGDVVYAFRDNAGGTAGDMYKSTASGWSQVTFGSEFTFSTGVLAPTVGQTIKGATSGATGVVTAVLLRAGAWSGTGVGSIVYTVTAGTFSSGELIKDNALATTYCTTTSVGAAITRAAGGSMEFVTANFTGSTATKKMYGCDGVNKAFEFDGTTYVPIRTGMTTDTPTHIQAHRNYLFLSFLGSVQYSALGAPYSWTAVLGAGEIATGDYVTGMIPQGGTGSGSSMAIFTSGKTFMLYGSSSSDFQLVISTFDLGYSAFTAQPVGNNTFGLTARGVQSLITTLTYGDFEYASITHLIQSLITAKRGLETASSSSQIKNQYRLFFNDNTGIVVGLTGGAVDGIMYLNYGRVVRCITTATLSTGEEVTYFGSDDGYVYRDNIGTSFDGETIEAWIRPAFNNLKSPRLRKRFRRAVFEVKAEGYAQVNVAYDLGYGSPNVNPSAIASDTPLIGGGGYWDQFTWDQFTWDTQIFADPSISIEGTEKNISFFFYSNRAQDKSHTVQGVTLLYSERRVER